MLPAHVPSPAAPGPISDASEDKSESGQSHPPLYHIDVARRVHTDALVVELHNVEWHLAASNYPHRRLRCIAEAETSLEVKRATRRNFGSRYDRAAMVVDLCRF